MTGLLFIGGDFPLKKPLNHFLIKENISIIAAADSGANTANALGVHPQLIIGDMDSIDSLLLKRFKSDGVELIYHRVDKDDSDTQLAIRLLRGRGVDRLILVGGGGGRLDHLVALIRDLSYSGAADLWITKNEVIYRVTANNEETFRVVPGSEFSIFPLGEGESSFETRGLQWELSDLALSNSQYSLSNYSPAGLFSIRAKKESKCAIIFPIDALP